MVEDNLMDDPSYQREMDQYRSLLREQRQLVHGNLAARKAGSEVFDLQMMRLQVAELRWQAELMEQAPRQLAAVCDETFRFLAKSRLMIEETHRTNNKFLAQIAKARATLAESLKMLERLNCQG